MEEALTRDWKIWSLAFIFFCFIGWLYEVIVYSFEFGYGYVNRGFLFGPWLPVYGVGGILVILLLSGIKEKKLCIGKINVTHIVCFFLIVFICTIVELITSYLMEMVIGKWLWDYTMDIPNFQGRIALKSSLRFGIIGVSGLYIVWPILNTGFERMKKIMPRTFRFASILLTGIFMADVATRFFLGCNYVGP